MGLSHRDCTSRTKIRAQFYFNSWLLERLSFYEMFQLVATRKTIFLDGMAALKRAFGVVVAADVVAVGEKFTSSRSSWGEGRLGCWGGHHLERW